MNNLPLEKIVHADKICARCGATMRYADHKTTWRRLKYCTWACYVVAATYTPEQFKTSFWEKVNKDAPNGCWIWIGSRNQWNYGLVRFNNKALQAHRVAYAWEHGEIPTGKLVLHSCDNPPCCNPAHLRIGTDADNAADKVVRSPHKTITKPTLTAEQVRVIRTLYRAKRSGDKIISSNAVELSRRYGVTRATISKAALKVTWKHL